MSFYEDLVMQTQMNYSRYYSVYASGGTPYELSDKKPLPYKEQIEELVRQVKEAECVIVGGASGLSAAGGGDFYYGDTPSYRKYFGKFAEKYGFETVDTTSDGYRLLVISFDGTKPCFAENAKRQAIEHQELTIYYSSQCPYIHQSVELVRKTCEELETPYTLVSVDTLEKAKSLPCVFNNWAVFYRGKFVTVNLLDAAALKRLLKK